MILDALIGLVVGLFTGILGLIPAYSPDARLSSFGTSLGSSVAGLDGVFPVVALGACIGIVLAVRLFIAAWDLLVFLYHAIPFKAT